MSAEVASGVGFAVGAVAALISTPLAIRAAVRFDFYDHPRDYREHAGPTAFLGGAAIVLASLLAAVAVGGTGGKLLLILGCAVVMWLLGTLDDAIAVAPKWRVLATTG